MKEKKTGIVREFIQFGEGKAFHKVWIAVGERFSTDKNYLAIQRSIKQIIKLPIFANLKM